ncbi:MAG TPA: sugar transferase [Anaerolineales bacterium]|nr:sugar transferase [Anaerolineales bacterium]
MQRDLPAGKVMGMGIEQLATFPLTNIINRLIKRVFDIVAAFFGLILLTPFFLVIAALIKRDTPGPVFYRGPRIGRGGVFFKMLKFRTMFENEKSYQGLRVTFKEDERITPLGKWLRDTKLNELPQLWNVLVGDMSLVGPRPEDPSISRTWPLDIARDLLSVRPGITSPASILYRDEESMLHAGEVMKKYLHELSPDKMRLDQLYVHYQSFWLDLDVILWTFFLLIPLIKAYTPREQLLFVGPVTHLIQRYVGWFVWDFVAVVIAMLGASAIVGQDMAAMRILGMSFGYAVLFSAIGILLHTNQVKWPKATPWEWANLCLAWFIVTGMLVWLHDRVGVQDLRLYSMLILASLFAIGGFALGRSRERLLSGFRASLKAREENRGQPRQRVLIVGSGRTAEHIAWLMDHPTYAAKYQVAGFIDDDLLSQGMKIYGSKVIGQVQDIDRLLKERDIRLIVLADNRLAERKYKDFRDLAKSGRATVVVAPDVFGALARLDASSAENQADGNLNDFRWLVRRSRTPGKAWRAHTISTRRAAVVRKSRTSVDGD